MSVQDIYLPEFPKWALYYSGIFQTFKDKQMLFYYWFYQKQWCLDNEINKIKQIKFNFNIPFHGYGNKINNYEETFYNSHIKYLRNLKKSLNILLKSLEDMLIGEKDGLLEKSGIVLNTTKKKRNALVNLPQSMLYDKDLIHQDNFKTKKGQDIEKTFLNLVDKLKLENEKLLIELNNIENETNIDNSL